MNIREQQALQWSCFLQDALVPRLLARTRFETVWLTYLKYCEAINNDPLLTRIQMSRRLADCFPSRIITGKKVFSCDIRKDLFVEGER